MELDDILNGQEPEGETVAVEGVEPEVVTEDTPGQPRDESGRFAPKGDEPTLAVEAAPPAAQEAEHSPPPGLIEERRKRQEAEQRANALAQQLQQFQQVQQPAQEPYFPSVYDDEAGYTAALQQQAAQLAQQQMMPLVQQQIQNAQVQFSRQMMAAQNPDFLETEAAFFQMAEQNPVLRQEMLNQPDPVRFAYDYAKKAAEVRQIGSLDINAIKAAAVAEYLATQNPAPAPQQQQIPTSLADQQSARLVGAGAPTGPPTLDQILGR